MEKNNENIVDLSQCNRVEVIDKNGRSYVRWFSSGQEKVTISMQDDGRTMKVFIIKNKE